MAWGVGDDELPPRRREVPVRDVDGYPLLPLGAQPGGEQGQVGVVLTAVPAGALDRLQLVGEDRLGVVQQPPDQRRLAVVHRSGRREPQDIHPGAQGPGTDCAHQKYPSRLRSSIAASLVRSSARVWPRSVIRVAATSAITSATVAAADATAPGQGISPPVRYRTVAVNSGSSSPLVRYGFSASSRPSRSKTGRSCAK